MSEEDYKVVFAKILKKYMDLQNKTQKDLIDDLKLSSSTVSNWCTAQKMPRMNKVQMLADYFGIEKSDLIEDKSKEVELNKKDEKEITNVLESTREYLMSQDGLMFDGEPATEEGIQSILDALELGLEIAKKRNKEKYTPNKYKNKG